MLRVAAKPNANANHPTPPPTVNKARLQGCDSTQGGLDNSTTEKLGHRARAWDTRTGDTASSFSVSALVVCLFCFFSGFSRIPRRPGVWRRVEPCEWSRASSPGRGRAERHTPHVSLRVAHVSLTHTCTRALCFRFSFIARAPLHPSLPVLFFFRRRTATGTYVRREREMEIHIL